MPKKLPLLYSALMLTGVNLLLRFIGTGFQVYLSSRIGAAGIGLLQLTMSVGTLAMVAGIGGIRTATMYLTAEELGKKRPQNAIWILSGCFLYSILFSASISSGLYYFAPWLAENWIGDIRTVASLRLFAVFLPVTCLCAVMTGYFTAAQKIGTLACVEVAEQFFSMAITIILLTFWAGTNAARACLAVILGSALGGCLTLILLIFLRAREHSPRGAPIPVRSRILEASLPLAAADILKSGISTGENLMVPKRLALNARVADPLASFGLVSGMVFPVIMFPAAILFGLAELLIPELARCNAAGRNKRIDHLVEKSLRVSLVFGLTVGGILYLISDALCLKLYGDLDAAKFLRWYALLVPMLYCDAIVDAMTKGLGQQKICVRYNILTSVLDVALLFVLLPRWGMEGYFVSFLITHLLNFGLSIRRLLKITGVQLLLFRLLWAISGAMLGLRFAALLNHSLTRSFFYVVILISSLFLTGVVRRVDIRWAKSLIRKNDLTNR